MQVTVTFDDDLFETLSQQATESGLTLDPIVNRLLQVGLSSTAGQRNVRNCSVRVFDAPLHPDFDPARLKDIDAECEARRFRERLEGL